MRRLNNVDLPTFGRPTMATMGRLPGDDCAPTLFANDAPRILQSHLGQQIGVAGPVCIDPHEKLKKDSAAQQGFQLFARLSADLLEHSAALADQNTFVGIAALCSRISADKRAKSWKPCWAAESFLSFS